MKCPSCYSQYMSSDVKCPVCGRRLVRGGKRASAMRVTVPLFAILALVGVLCLRMSLTTQIEFGHLVLAGIASLGGAILGTVMGWLVDQSSGAS